MGSIWWLASYPKSGNTWVRALLANYQAVGTGLRENGPLDINRLGGTIAAARILFDEWVGIEASVLDDETVDRLRPAVYRCAAREAAGQVFMKVHDMFRRTSGGEPLFPPEVSAGAIYVVRSVLDVAMSLAHHGGFDAAAAVEKLCDPGHAVARSEGRLDVQLRQIVGSWSGHVRSWVDQPLVRVHLVRYEDLLRDPLEVLAGIVRFCGLPFDTKRLRLAVAFSSFEELQRQERAAGFAERLEESTAPFFRRGKADGWRDELQPELARRLMDAHGETLRRFGYRLDGETGVRMESTSGSYV